jgi:hypothetical protein
MKISYQKHWSEDGTVYDQCISMNEGEFANVKHAIDAEIAQGKPRKSEYVQTSGYEMYLKPIYQTGYSKRFLCHLNHTQTRFINLFCKLPLKDRNTYILIKNK